jgi:iron complex outermembrane recepter protein
MNFFSKIVILLSLSFFVNKVQAQCTLKFNGIIYDEGTKQILSSATVSINEISLSKTTNAKGEFIFEGLCPGHYDVTISHVGCKTITTHIHIKDDYYQQYILPHSVNEIAEVKVNGVITSTTNATEIKGKLLDAVKGGSLAQALTQITGVSVLQTGTNIYKPIIHGLHSSRVLILNNGIRQEGQQWGNEHAPEIDIYTANRIAVVKGASTLRYGGDAIGGIVLVEPKLLRTLPGIGGDVNVAYFSNNRMPVLSGLIEGNFKNKPSISWRLQGTLKRGGNAKTPNYWLDNSGTQEYNFSATLGIKKQKWSTEFFYSQFNTKLAIFSGSHIGNVTDLVQAINSAAPPDYIKNVGFSYTIQRPYQQVQHHLVKSKTVFNTGKKSRLNIITSFQYNNRKEYDKKRFQSSDNGPQLDLSIATLNTDVVWDHFYTKNVRGTIGVMGNYQNNQYSQRLFIPNYEALNAGAFIIEKFEKNKWLFEGGLRYDYRNFFNTNTNGGINYKDKNYSSVSANLGTSFRLNSGVKFLLNASTAWRSPNINELYSDGLHHGAARIEKGDINLLAERANSLMFTIEVVNDKLSFELSSYLKYINNFIYLAPTYPPQLTIRGAFPVFEFKQTDAKFTGIDASIKYQINHHLHFISKASIVRGWNKIAKEWLIQIPADRFDNEIEYNFNNNQFFKDSYIKIFTQNVLMQKRTPATGNIEITQPNGTKVLTSDYMPPPKGYMLLGAEAGAQIAIGKKIINASVTGTNIANTVYRDYMNAFRYFADEMGRNFAVRIKMPFEIKKK